jgi:hypothetical protein
MQGTATAYQANESFAPFRRRRQDLNISILLSGLQARPKTVVSNKRGRLKIPTTTLSTGKSRDFQIRQSSA